MHSWHALTCTSYIYRYTSYIFTSISTFMYKITCIFCTAYVELCKYKLPVHDIECNLSEIGLECL